MFSTEKIFKWHVEDCFKINDEQMIKMPKKMNTLDSKIIKKIKSLFMIYEDFGVVLVPEDNVKEILEDSDANKYKKHVGFSYGWKLVYVDNWIY